eukprot:2750937-Rhodomonas_salina.1
MPVPAGPPCASMSAAPNLNRQPEPGPVLPSAAASDMGAQAQCANGGIAAVKRKHGARGKRGGASVKRRRCSGKKEAGRGEKGGGAGVKRRWCSVSWASSSSSLPATRPESQCHTALAPGPFETLAASEAFFKFKVRIYTLTYCERRNTDDDDVTHDHACSRHAGTCALIDTDHVPDTAHDPTA